MSHCILDHFKQQPLWLLALFSLGAITVLKSSLALLNWVYVSFLRPSKNLKKYGSWALVTGATDGIGKAFAFELAKKGLNLILVGRNPEKLKAVSDEILTKYAKVQIKNVVMDFSGELDEGVKKIKDEIEGLDVGVLINNVGVSYPYVRFFHEVDDDLLRNLIKVNVEGTTKVTQAVLPGMLARKKGAIVNIGSGAANVIRRIRFTPFMLPRKCILISFRRVFMLSTRRAVLMCNVRKMPMLLPLMDGYEDVPVNSERALQKAVANQPI